MNNRYNTTKTPETENEPGIERATIRNKLGSVAFFALIAGLVLLILLWQPSNHSDANKAKTVKSTFGCIEYGPARDTLLKILRLECINPSIPNQLTTSPEVIINARLSPFSTTPLQTAVSSYAHYKQSCRIFCSLRGRFFRSALFLLTGSRNFVTMSLY